MPIAPESKIELNFSFDDTQVAFAHKSDYDLRRAHVLFKLIGSNTLVKLSKPFATFAAELGLPISWAVKPTLYKQFCGGEDIDDCQQTIDMLAEYGVGTILDYSVEGKETDAAFDSVVAETIAGIKKATNNPKIPFSVFKITGIAPFALLEKVSTNHPLTANEQTDWDKVKTRVATICQAAANANQPLFFDAEESWIQEAVDQLCYPQMALYNKTTPIVYNTIQLYLKSRYAHMQQAHQMAKANGYIAAFKLVRGAYMEKERNRAEEQGYPSPVQDTKAATDYAFDQALHYCVNHIDTLALCCGSHNEASSLLLAQLMAEKGLANNHPHIYFSQLLGMSDTISFNLAHAGYNVAKYVPYGPVREVLPYLLRRAEENTSVAGQTPRELSLITKELQRRKL